MLGTEIYSQLLVNSLLVLEESNWIEWTLRWKWKRWAQRRLHNLNNFTCLHTRWNCEHSGGIYYHYKGAEDLKSWLNNITSYNKYYLHSYKNVQISYSNLMMKEEIRGTKASCYAVIMLSDLAGSWWTHTVLQTFNT